MVRPESEFSILVHCPMGLAEVSGSRIRARLIIDNLVADGVRVALIAPNVSPEVGDGILQFVPQESDLDLADQLEYVARNFGADLIYAITDGSASSIKEASDRVGIPHVFDLHAVGLVETLELGRDFWGPSYRTRIHNNLRGLWHLRRADGVTVANPTLLPIARILNTDAHLAPGLVDTTIFCPQGRRHRAVDETLIHVLYAGNLHPWQGLELLYSAAARLIAQDERFCFSFVLTTADARSDPSLGTLIEASDSDRIRIEPPVSHTQMPSLLRGADILVIPRPWTPSTYLAFPCKLAEYMAVGKAVLATNLAPHRFALRDGENGILCRPSPTGIVNGLLRLTSARFRESLGQRARKEAETRYEARHTVREILVFLRRLCRV